MTMADEVHVHIPAGFKGTIHLHVDDTAAAPDAVSPAQPVDPLKDPALASMLGRFERYSKSDLRPTEIAAMFLDRGYKPILPAPWEAPTTDSSYIRWVVVGSARSITLYQNSAAVWSSAQPQAEFASRVAGGTKKQSGWYFYLTLGRDAIGAALDAFVGYGDDRGETA